VQSVLDDFAPSLRHKGVAIEFEAGAGAQVRFDADAVTQILGNLIGNVEKYAAGGGALHVASRQDGDTTTITVTDKGPGIPEDQRDAVFEPFHRVSDRLNDGVAGTGIGLPIARQLARLHGGDVRLVGCNDGACFEVELSTPRAETGEKP
jgi:signal transduction histidine kinase